MGVIKIGEEFLKVQPLNKAEYRWVIMLQKVLSACPKRLEIVTIGDPALQIIDNTVYSELSDGAAGEDGVVLACISGGPKVHGVSG